jgi:hypothetical protein
MLPSTDSDREKAFSPETRGAHALLPQQRQNLAIQALAGEQSIRQLADQFGASRKFVYQQADKAQQALQAAFADDEADDQKGLFYLPVTKKWIYSVAMALILVGHSSYRGVVEIFRDLFDWHLSVGTVHNLVMQAVSRARVLQVAERLDRVRAGAHDEIFQGRSPILVGADVESTFIYLLSEEAHRDGDTWAIRLWECADKGLSPEFTVADGGKGLRAGQAIVWPGRPCRADVFHALLDLGRLAAYLERRALGALTAEDQIEKRMAKAKARGHGNQYSKRRFIISKKLNPALTLADDCATLNTWLRKDVLALNALDLETRRANFDFIVAELRAREPLAPHRIGPVRKMLENQRDDLLAFVAEIDRDLMALAAEFQRPIEELRLRFDGRGLDDEPLDPVDESLRAIARRTIRASSLIENVNSRIRPYIFLRRRLGPAHLDLLRFFLNHRRFLRSEHPERVDKSPAELLTGQTHSHWLEMLGFQCFRRN